MSGVIVGMRRRCTSSGGRKMEKMGLRVCFVSVLLVCVVRGQKQAAASVRERSGSILKT